ncbi:MAG: hypothetical protein AAF658_00960, partial [Myxococcota bacterium]
MKIRILGFAGLIAVACTQQAEPVADSEKTPLTPAESETAPVAEEPPPEPKPKEAADPVEACEALVEAAG